RFAAMLRSDLYDSAILNDGIPGRLRFRQHIAHWLFNVRILARFRCQLQNWRVRVLGRGNNHGVDIFKRKHILQILKRAWLAAIILCVLGDSFLPVHAPQSQTLVISTLWLFLSRDTIQSNSVPRLPVPMCPNEMRSLAPRTLL